MLYQLLWQMLKYCTANLGRIKCMPSALPSQGKKREKKVKFGKTPTNCPELPVKMQVKDKLQLKLQIAPLWVYMHTTVSMKM